MRTFIERLDRERGEALATIDGALERAGGEDRDLTDAENAMLTEARARLERIDRERSEWTELAERRAAGDAMAERINTALVRTAPAQLQTVQGVITRDAVTDLWPDAGHYVHDVVTRSENHDAAQRLERAVANQLLADNPGIVPEPIVGPVINLIDAARPFVNSINRRPMPGGGQVFTRPIVTQHTAVDLQSAEKTEIASQKMVVTSVPVTKKTYGGSLDISFQNRDWTDPAILSLVINDLAAVYARQTNNGAADAFATAVTVTQDTGGGGGPALQGALAAASATINAATNQMPDTLWVAPDVWGIIAGFGDTTGRPLFNVIGTGGGPSNAGSVGVNTFAGNVYGLRLVVDSNLPAGTAIVGIASMTEFYEQIGGQLTVTEPTILGFVVAYYGYVAWLTPVPAAFVKITGIAPAAPAVP